MAFIYPCSVGIIGSTRVAPILTQYCLRTRSKPVPMLDRVRKQYWAKVVQNFATRATFFVT